MVPVVARAGTAPGPRDGCYHRSCIDASLTTRLCNDGNVERRDETNDHVSVAETVKAKKPIDLPVPKSVDDDLDDEEDDLDDEDDLDGDAEDEDNSDGDLDDPLGEQPDEDESEEEYDDLDDYDTTTR